MKDDQSKTHFPIPKVRVKWQKADLKQVVLLVVGEKKNVTKPSQAVSEKFRSTGKRQILVAIEVDHELTVGRLKLSKKRRHL